MKMKNLRCAAWLDRRRMYTVIFGSDTRAGRAFDVAVMVAIVLSLVVAFVETLPALGATVRTVLRVSEYVLTSFFTVEYVARLYCSPRRRDYALSFFGVVDLVATLPLYLSWLLPGARYFLLLRSVRLLRVFRVFKLFSFINEGYLLMESMRRSAKKILVYFLFVLVLVTCLGAVMYMVEGTVEGSGFTDLGTSVYWAIVTLTTVGYGDITPVTGLGKVLSAFVMLLGYTIIAVPTGIVSATFIDEVNRRGRPGVCPRCGGRVGRSDRFCSHCGEKL